MRPQTEIKSIEFIFENCECLTIDGRYIGDLIIEDIRTSIRRVACNSIMRMVSCKSFAISINKLVNIKTIHTGFDEVYPLERINSGTEITYIIITYSDNSTETIYMNWSNESEWHNPYQKSLITKKGDLYLVIDKELNIEDIWDENYINDNHKWGIVYGIE